MAGYRRESLISLSKHPVQMERLRPLRESKLHLLTPPLHSFTLWQMHIVCCSVCEVTRMLQVSVRLTPWSPHTLHHGNCSSLSSVEDHLGLMHECFSACSSQSASHFLLYVVIRKLNEELEWLSRFTYVQGCQCIVPIYWYCQLHDLYHPNGFCSPSPICQ